MNKPIDRATVDRLIAKSRRQANARNDGTSDRPNLLDLCDVAEDWLRKEEALKTIVRRIEEYDDMDNATLIEWIRHEASIATHI